MITAKIIADSVSMEGIRLTTFELEYPRFIHSEFMTHRVFSRNAASSRAIPVAKMHEMIETEPAMPVHWGKNQPGMQAHEELEGVIKQGAIDTWKEAAKESVRWAKVMADIGVHKQIVNRITEPFTNIKTVVTSTEWANFFNLRYHADAQPEIFELAKMMRHAIDVSIPTAMVAGDWHLPYDPGTGFTLDQRKMISASCCAQVSYRKNDDTLEKAQSIYNRLIHSQPCHASPVEHQATPISLWAKTGRGWENGITHQDRHRQLWSNNFRGWVQNRAMLGI